MTLEEKYAVGLGVLSVALLAIGVGVGRFVRTAPPRVVRVFFPLAVLATLASFAVYVAIARAHVKG